MSRERKEPDFDRIVANNSDIIRVEISEEARESLRRGIEELVIPFIHKVEELRREGWERAKHDKRKFKSGLPIPSSS